jgi:hypothetical protein
VDPRLDGAGSTSLTELSGNGTFALPQQSGVSPFWLVPTHCTSLTNTVNADQPVNLDFFYESGEPEVYGSHVGDAATATTHAAQVSPGIWADDVGQVGPFSSAAPAGTATVSATAKCRLFDPAVTTSAGDFWQEGVTSQSANTRGVTPGDSSPLQLRPGQTGKIVVTFRPQGHAGKVVKGVLYVDTSDPFTDAGNELAAIPYEYTIK